MELALSTELKPSTELALATPRHSPSRDQRERLENSDKAMDFNERALRRIRLLTVAVGAAGTLVALVKLGIRPAVGFLIGATLSVANFEGISMLAHAIGGTQKPKAVATLLIALRYVLIGCALYVIVRILGFTPMAVLAGLLAAFGAVLLEIFYELIFQRGNF